MYLLCRSLPRTSLNIIAGLPLSPLCSLQLSLLCSLPWSLVCTHLLMFAVLTGLTGLTGVTGLTGSKMNYKCLQRNSNIWYIIHSYQLNTRYWHNIRFWSNLLLLLLLQMQQLVSELEGSSFAALVGSLMISFRPANLLINNLDFHTFLLLEDQTYHYHRELQVIVNHETCRQGVMIIWLWWWSKQWS